MSNPSFSSFLQEVNLQIFGEPSLKQQEILFSSLDQCKNSTKTPCNKRISPDELAFECYECALDLECHLICHDCFMKISHQGHKYRYSTNKAGLCDCGNPFAIKSHCGDHESSILSNTLIKEFIPMKILTNLKEFFFKNLFNFFQICEKYDKRKEEIQKPTKPFVFLLRYLKSLLQKKSPAMDLLIIEILTTKLTDLDYQMHHICQNLTLLQYEEKEHKCECSFLELYFRFNLTYKDDKFWKKLREIFEFLLKYPIFRKELALVYSKMWNFIVFLPKYPNIFTLKMSKFFDLYTHFFPKDISDIWLKAYHFLTKLIEKTADIIDSFFTSLNVHAYNAFDQIKSLFLFILKRESLASCLEPRILESFIQVINRTHNPKNLIEEDNEKCRLHIECILLLIFKSFLSILLKTMDSKLKFSFFEGILKKLLECLKDIYTKPNPTENMKEMQNKWPLHNTLQRSLVLILISLIFKRNDGKDENEGFEEDLKTFSFSFNEKIKSIFEKEQDFYDKTVKTLLVSIKFSQEKVKPVTFYEIFDNPFEGMKREVINGFYKKSYYLQNDYDQVLLQMLLILNSDPKNFLKTYAASFDIDLAQIFFKANDEIYKTNLKNLLNNLVALVNDETSLLNASGFLQLKSQEFNENLKFLIINTFQNSRINDLSSAKSLLYDKVLSYDVPIEQAIKDTTYILNNTKILRLKPEYENYYDPYIFYKYPKLSNECYENIKRLMTKSTKNDLILGNYIQKPAKSFSFYVKKVLFSCELPRFLAVIFKIDAFTKDFNEILKHTIKLTYLNLLTIEEILINEPQNPQFQSLLLNYKQYFQPVDFIEKLDVLKNKVVALQDTKSSLQKIIDILKRLKEMSSVFDQKKQEISEKISGKILDESFTEDKKVEKKSGLQKKQEKLKKEFMEKQKAFLQKNLSTILEPIPNQSEKKEESLNLTCLYCFDTFTPASSYGVYIYLSLDNMACTSQGKLKNFFKKIKKQKPTFSLTSCLHYVHKECNEKTLKNNLKALVQKKVLYTSILESLCGHCKSLNNLFVYFSEEKILATRYFELKNSHIELEFTHNYIIDIIKNLNMSVQVKGTVKEEFKQLFSKDCSDFFDSMLRVLLNYEENEDFLKQEETVLLDLLLEILKTSARNVSLNGLGPFLKKNRSVYRNVYLMFREYFWTFQSKDKEKFINDLKTTSFSLIKNLFVSVERPDIEDIDIQMEFLLWIIALLFKNEDSTLYLMCTHICLQVFLIYYVYYAFMQLSLLHIEVLEMDFNGFLKSLSDELKKNSDFKALLATNLTQISRKMIGINTIIFRFNEKELQSFFPENFLSDEEEMIFYSGKFPFILDNPPQELLKTQFFQDFWKQILQLKTKSGASITDFLEYYPLNYHILTLPQNFYGFQQAFGLKKCEICSDFSRKGSLYMCLCCGELLCPVDCKLDKKKKNIGNLNAHAKLLHAGKGGFMNMRDSLVILMNYPRSIAWGKIYRDSYGEMPNERTWKWEDFVLDTKMYNKIQDIIIGKRIPQEICYRLMENEQIVLDIDYL